jgi:hypothetical protein
MHRIAFLVLVAFASCTAGLDVVSTSTTAQALTAMHCEEIGDDAGHYAGCSVTDENGDEWILMGPRNGHGGLNEESCLDCGPAAQNDLNCQSDPTCADGGGGGDPGGGGGYGGAGGCGNCFQDSAGQCHCGTGAGGPFTN